MGDSAKPTIVHVNAPPLGEQTISESPNIAITHTGGLFGDNVSATCNGKNYELTGSIKTQAIQAIKDTISAFNNKGYVTRSTPDMTAREKRLSSTTVAMDASPIAPICAKVTEANVAHR